MKQTHIDIDSSRVAPSVIQAAFVPIGYPGPSEVPSFHFNMYTAPGFFAFFFALTNLVLLVFLFKEHRIIDDELKSVQQERKTEDLENTMEKSIEGKLL